MLNYVGHKTKFGSFLFKVSIIHISTKDQHKRNDFWNSPHLFFTNTWEVPSKNRVTVCVTITLVQATISCHSQYTGCFAQLLFWLSLVHNSPQWCGEGTELWIQSIPTRECIRRGVSCVWRAAVSGTASHAKVQISSCVLGLTAFFLGTTTGCFTHHDLPQLRLLLYFLLFNVVHYDNGCRSPT